MNHSREKKSKKNASKPHTFWSRHPCWRDVWYSKQVEEAVDRFKGVTENLISDFSKVNHKRVT
jgi:hypothetical protein